MLLSRFELRRFRGPLPVLALLFVLLVPVVYGAVYLAANWDPYGRLKNLPVAIVNADKPVDYDGRTVAAGKDITDELLEGNSFQWHVTDAADADAGLAEGRYYLVLDIPSDFSAHLISAASEKPLRAELTLRRNDANGFVIGSVTGQAQSKIERSVDQAAVDAYFQAVFKNLQTIRTGLSDAADGSQQVTDGLTSAKSGSAQLVSGLATTEKGSGTLATGLTSASTGATKLASGANTLNDNMPALVDGAAQLDSGLDQLQTGSTKLADGATALGSGVGQLADGATSLSTGLNTLTSGSAKVADGATQVADGTQQLADKAVPVLDAVAKNQTRIATTVATVNQGIQDVHDGLSDAPDRASGALDTARSQLAALAAADPAIAQTEQYQAAVKALETAGTRLEAIASDADALATDAETLNAAVQDAAAQGTPAKLSEQLTALNTGAHQVATGAAKVTDGAKSAQAGAAKLASGATSAQAGATKVATGATQLNAGITSANTGAGKLHTGTVQVADATGQLAEGTDSLATGLAKADTGAKSLHTGLVKLHDGATTLDAGLAELASGSSKLTTSLSDAVAKIPSVTGSNADQASWVLSQPVDVHSVIDNPARVYGRGLAPLFFSIAMWVFGISGFLVMRPISGRLLAGRMDPLRLAIAAWTPFGAVALAGAGLMLGTTWLTLGLDPVHGVALVGVVALTALVFSGIAHLFRTALGLPGSALLLVWLILQLSSTGGTYPAEVLPAFFRWIHPLMPISYTIDAFRYAISGGLTSRFLADMAVLVLIGGVVLVLDVLAVAARQRFRISDLHPPLQH